MPRAMTTYDPGIRTVTRTVTQPCVGCGKDETRNLSATGVGTEPEDRIAAWVARPWYHVACWRKAGRPQ